MNEAQQRIFFDHIRGSLFGGAFTQAQVDGIKRLLSAWDRFGTGLLRHLAYVLATSYHETGRRMNPVRETYAESDEQAAARLEAAWRAGRLPWVSRPYWRRDASGKYWYGRGDVQLTHPENYCGVLRTLILRLFGVDICADPNQVLRPDISAFILIEGMIRGETGKGDFTRYALEDFITPERVDYRGARRIVNGTDRADLIARHARKFEEGLIAAGVPLVRPPAPDRPAVEHIVPLPPRPARPLPEAPLPPFRPRGGESGGAGASGSFGTQGGAPGGTQGAKKPPAGKQGGGTKKG